jgi:hypothetical protein
MNAAECARHAAQLYARGATGFPDFLVSGLDPGRTDRIPACEGASPEGLSKARGDDPGCGSLGARERLHVRRQRPRFLPG